MLNTKFEAFFLTSGGKKIFITCYFSEMSNSESRSVILIPPFAEEMNKSRRMMSLQARQLSRLGFQVLLPDVYGTGDSHGDFNDATSEIWVDNIADCIDYFSAKGFNSTNIIACRFGALLIAELQKRHYKFDAIVLWQPLTSGEMLINQFLRLRIASGMFSGEAQKESTRDLRSLLESGRSVEVAGYELSSDLVLQLDKLNLKELDVQSVQRLLWIDVAASEDKPMPLMARKLIEQWNNETIGNVASAKVLGIPFWSSVEIEENNSLIEATSEFLRG